MKIAPLAELVSTNVPWKQFRKETFIKLTRKPAPIAALVQMFARSKQSTRHKAKQALYLIDKAAPRDGLFLFPVFSVWLPYCHGWQLLTF
jgi:hypothetical protein